MYHTHVMKTKSSVFKPANSKITQHIQVSNIITGVVLHIQTIWITHSKTAQLRISGKYLYEQFKEWWRGAENFSKRLLSAPSVFSSLSAKKYTG